MCLRECQMQQKILGSIPGKVKKIEAQNDGFLIKKL